MGFSFSIPPEFEKKLQQLSDIDRIAPKMLEAAAPIVVKAIQTRAPERTGTLKKNIKVSKPTLSKRGSWMCNIYFNGYEKRKLKNGETVKIPNAVKAAAAEFGTSKDSRNKQEKKPFIKPALESSSDEVAEKLQEIYNAEVSRNA